MVRRQLKKTRYRRYYCRLDQLFDTLGTGLSERISMLRRSPGASSAPRRNASGRDQKPRMKRSSIQLLKLRTRCARCRKLGHWARECPEGNRGQRNDERYDGRAVRPGENSRGFITVAKPTKRRPFFLDVSWTFVSLDPGEVLWDTGAQEGLVGKQQLDKWCKMLAEHGLQVEWSQEKPESASGIGGTTKPIGVVYVPVGLAGCNGIIRSLLWSRMSHALCKADTRSFVPTNLIPMVDSFQKSRNWVRTTLKDAQQIPCQSSHTCTRDPDAWTTIHQ